LELAFEKLGEEVQTIFEKESERISSELRERLELLLEHYKISDVPTLSDAKRWRALAYALARDFVPGMQVLKRAPRKRGRPPTKKWKESRIAAHLVEVVESIRLERKKGISDAVRTAKKRYPKAWPGMTADSLVSRYYEAVKVISDSKAKRPYLLD
jgi:hypothetical protein